MSRITADVIDVLKNEQTRVEILDIDGEDPKQALGKKLYKHFITFDYGEPCDPVIIDSNPEPITAETIVERSTNAISLYGIDSIGNRLIVGRIIVNGNLFSIEYYDYDSESFATDSIILDDANLEDAVTEV